MSSPASNLRSNVLAFINPYLLIARPPHRDQPDVLALGVTTADQCFWPTLPINNHLGSSSARRNLHQRGVRPERLCFQNQYRASAKFSLVYVHYRTFYRNIPALLLPSRVAIRSASTPSDCWAYRLYTYNTIQLELHAQSLKLEHSARVFQLEHSARVFQLEHYAQCNSRNTQALSARYLVPGTASVGAAEPS